MKQKIRVWVELPAHIDIEVEGKSETECHNKMVTILQDKLYKFKVKDWNVEKPEQSLEYIETEILKQDN